MDPFEYATPKTQGAPVRLLVGAAANSECRVATPYFAHYARTRWGSVRVNISRPSLSELIAAEFC